MPIMTNTTIATCIQIEIGDMRHTLAARVGHPSEAARPASMVFA
jgi:hypothetical protein